MRPGAGRAVNDVIVSRVTDDSLMDVVVAAAAGTPIRADAVVRDPRTLDVDPYGAGERYGAVRKLVASGDTNALIASLKASGLRGMGGAGFPTGLKWEIVRNAPGDDKYIVCNADESEPGTIKDRFIMSNVPHLLVEGMILAGLVTGARQGIVYIRHEYEEQIEIVEHEIATARADGLLGANILGSGLTFDLEIFVSPGGYICGEETALLEAHRRQARRAAQQAAVPRHARPVRQADRRSTTSRRSSSCRRSWPTAPTGSRLRARTARPG